MKEMVAIKSKLLALGFVSITLAGCSTKLDCGSTDAQKLVSQLVVDNNLLARVYQTAFVGTAEKIKTEIGQKNAIELSNRELDLQKLRSELVEKQKLCISQFSEDQEIKKMKSEVEQSQGQLQRLQNSSPKLKSFSNAELMQMNSQQSTNTRRAAEVQYMNEKSEWSQKVDQMNSDFHQQLNRYNSSLEWTKNSCELKINQANMLKADPQLMTKVNAHIESIVIPLANKVKEAAQSIELAKTNSELEKEDAINKAVQVMEETIKKSPIRLENIVTTSSQNNGGTLMCRAGLKLDVKDLIQANGTIYYKLEKTTKGEMYGTVIRLE